MHNDSGWRRAPGGGWSQNPAPNSRVDVLLSDNESSPEGGREVLMEDELSDHINWSMVVAYRPVDQQESVLDLCKAVVEAVEGAPGYGTLRNAEGVRLKDHPAWVAFYNGVKSANGEAPWGHPFDPWSPAIAKGGAS